MKRSPLSKYNYVILYIYVEESELVLWQTLGNQDKAESSRSIFGMIERELPALRKSALKTMPRAVQKSRSRRLLLLDLPEFREVISFLRSNMRRPALRNHLKSLLLYGESQLDLTEEPAVAAEPAPDPAPVKEPERPKSPRSPRELFSDPEKLVQTMVVDLRLPENERTFDWNTVTPDEYPDDVKSMGLFGFLLEHWNNREASCAADT